ncbi:MAG: PfkB family carbohydrate kinase [Anaerolineae bacterium]
MNPTPDYVVVGHVTRDLDAQGGWRAGGTATYAALTAARLGVRVGVLTAAVPGTIGLEGQDGIEVSLCSSPESTTFENFYLDGHREQYVRAVATPLVPEQLPAAWLQAPVVHLGPIAQEVDIRFLEAFDEALVGVTPQGWLRAWDADGRVRAVRFAHEEQLLQRADAIILSLEDLGGDRGWLERLASVAPLLVETRGREGAVIFQRGLDTHVPAFWAQEVDPTGAGDVFAAAFLLRYRECRDPVDAARFANCVASFVVEAPGATNLPTRPQVSRRLLTGRVRA